ncbi:MAG: hypothetical protein LUE87_04950 [Lachnospiraceae bacterium]|nr:hypothetical protein [Lachnospiraceae bacterium]
MLLPLLWENNADKNLTARVRYLYMDSVTKLVKKDFSVQIGTWCREHGVQYIGHLIEDNNHHSRTGSSLGHYFRGLAGQDMAGIDDIGGQVYPQGEEDSYNRGMFEVRNGEFYHYVMGKLAGSAAAIEPLKRGNSMCEIFGNYGWKEGVRLEKYLADHFLVRGINHFVPHAFSPKEFPDPDCPPHFYAHGHNPQYRHFGALMAYMNRVCELLSGGRHIAPVAVMYTGEGDWTGKYMNCDQACHVLADHQIEYDILPQDVFSERQAYGTQIREGMLKVNTQEYRAVIVPYMQFVTGSFAQAVMELGEKGIGVYFIHDYPDGICDGPVSESEPLLSGLKENGSTINLEDLPEILRGNHIPEISLEPANDRIRYIHYAHSDQTEIWMFVNEGTTTYEGRVRLPEAVCLREEDKNPEWIESSCSSSSSTFYRYDAWANLCLPAEEENGYLNLTLEPLKSCIYVMDYSVNSSDSAAKIRPLPIYEGKTDRGKVPFTGIWRRGLCTGLEYPIFSAFKEVALPDHLAEELPEFSGFARYENTFNAGEGERIYLKIADAHEGVEVFLNEISLGIQIVPVFLYDLSPALRTGENKLRIEVATTLERELAKIPPNMFAPPQPATSLSGITGTVELWRVEN